MHFDKKTTGCKYTDQIISDSPLRAEVSWRFHLGAAFGMTAVAWRGLAFTTPFGVPNVTRSASCHCQAVAQLRGSRSGNTPCSSFLITEQIGSIHSQAINGCWPVQVQARISSKTLRNAGSGTTHMVR
jgi:hypothetical protein